MAPKKVDKKSERGQQKALEKEKVKIADDKTFGLKNKNKSKTVQKFIKGVQQAAKGSHSVSEQKQQELQQKEEKKREAQQAALLASLFKGTENIKKITVDERRTDPLSIKEGQQIDLYVDQREQKKQETMEDWDQEKLEEVIKTKHGASQAKPTEIVCKYFVDALEKRQYGWFWNCPNNGDNCKYRHCLPPGYVLKRDLPKEEIDEDDVEPIEEVIERERAKLKGEGTKVTLETFLAWKKKKEEQRRDAVEAARLAEQKKSGGRGLNALSGRDLFSFDPSLFVDDAAAAAEQDYEEDEEYWNALLNENQEIVERANREALEERSDGDSSEDEEEEKNNGTGSSSSSSAATAVSNSHDKNKDVIIGRENLFLEGDLPNLDDLDD